MSRHAHGARVAPAAADVGTPAEGRDEWLFYYDWFAGWRWERHRNGGLIAESLQSFETKDDCMRDADQQRRERHVYLATRRD